MRSSTTATLLEKTAISHSTVFWPIISSSNAWLSYFNRIFKHQWIIVLISSSRSFRKARERRSGHKTTTATSQSFILDPHANSYKTSSNILTSDAVSSTTLTASGLRSNASTVCSKHMMIKLEKPLPVFKKLVLRFLIQVQWFENR